MTLTPAVMRSAAAHALALGGGLALTWSALPFTALQVPSVFLQAISVICTVVVAAGVGGALGAQPVHDEGDRSMTDGVMAGLLTMGLLTLAGLVVVGRSNPVFFGAAAVSAHSVVFAAAWTKSTGSTWVAVGGPIASMLAHVAAAATLYGWA